MTNTAARGAHEQVDAEAAERADERRPEGDPDQRAVGDPSPSATRRRAGRARSSPALPAPPRARSATRRRASAERAVEARIGNECSRRSSGRLRAAYSKRPSWSTSTYRPSRSTPRMIARAIARASPRDSSTSSCGSTATRTGTPARSIPDRARRACGGTDAPRRGRRRPRRPANAGRAPRRRDCSPAPRRRTRASRAARGGQRNTAPSAHRPASTFAASSSSIAPKPVRAQTVSRS